MEEKKNQTEPEACKVTKKCGGCRKEKNGKGKACQF